MKYKIDLFNKNLKEKEKNLKNQENKILFKKKELEYNKWIKELKNKNENQIIEYAKKQIFFKYSDELFEKYSSRIKKKFFLILASLLTINYRSWELIKQCENENDNIYKFTIGKKCLFNVPSLTTLYLNDTPWDFDLNYWKKSDYVFQEILNYIEDNSPVEVFYSKKDSYFISERLKTNGFSLKFVNNGVYLQLQTYIFK